MSITRWMDKEDVVHIHNEILLSHKKEWICVSSSEVDEPRACYTPCTLYCIDTIVHTLAHTFEENDNNVIDLTILYLFEWTTQLESCINLLLLILSYCYSISFGLNRVKRDLGKGWLLGKHCVYSLTCKRSCWQPVWNIFMNQEKVLLSGATKFCPRTHSLGCRPWSGLHVLGCSVCVRFAISTTYCSRQVYAVDNLHYCMWWT